MSSSSASAAALLGNIKSRFQQLQDIADKWKSVGATNSSLAAQLAGPIEADSVRIAAERDALLSSRRQLMQLTKEFAKVEEPVEKLARLGPLVKAFQGHVDEAARCLRSVEVARSGLHDVVRQLEDPSAAIERLLRHRAELEEGVAAAQQGAALRERVRDLEEELSELRNQEVTIAALREQLAEAQLAAAQEKQQAASDVSAEVAEVLRSWQQRETALRQDNAALGAEVRRLQRAGNESSLQFVNMKQQLEQLQEQREKEAERCEERQQGLEVQLLVARRELKHLQESVVAHLQQELHESERNRQQLEDEIADQKQKLRNGSSGAALSQQQQQFTTPHQRPQPPSADDGEVASARDDRVLSELRQRVAGLEAARAQLEGEHAQQVDSLRAQLIEMERWGNEAHRQYSSCRESYEQSKKEMVRMKRIARDATEEARDLRKQVLELESTLAKQQEQQQQQQQQQCEENISASAAVIMENMMLIAPDRPSSSSNVKTSSRPATPTTEMQQAAKGAGFRSNSSSSNFTSVSGAKLSFPGSSASNSATLEAITAQRDQLKRRLLNLEDASQRELALLRHEIAALRAERQQAEDGLVISAGSASSSSSSTALASMTTTMSGGVTVVTIPHHSSSSSAGQSLLARGGSGGAGHHPNIVDAAGALIAKFVNTNATTRRIFVGYLFSLHMFFFLWLALH